MGARRAAPVGMTSASVHCSVGGGGSETEGSIALCSSGRGSTNKGACRREKDRHRWKKLQHKWH
eukprot:5600869-Prorocentrum_lima.AAC.1